MHNKNNKKIGFSLIELMVAVAIIGILTAVASPVYLSYTIKSNVAAALPILDGLKNKVMDYYVSNDGFPENLTQIDATSHADNLIASSTVTNDSTYNGITDATLGSVQVTFKSSSSSSIPAQLSDKILSLVAIDDPNVITWKCISGDKDGNNQIDAAYLPKSCQ